MPQGIYLPEGYGKTPATPEALERAMRAGTRTEGIATLCDEGRNLYVRMGRERGVIPRSETGLGAEEGRLRDIAILSRVGKPVAFLVTGRKDGLWQLSRRALQEQAQRFLLEQLQPGEIIRARVTHLEQFGAFVDMGCGLISMIGVENVSVSRIRTTAQRFHVGQDIYAAVLRCDARSGRVWLTHRELLGTWEQNAALLQPGAALRGIVRGVEPYGVFIELTPNLSGLAETGRALEQGMDATVLIKSIQKDRMKIKLSVLEAAPGSGVRWITPEDYYLKEGLLRRWQYQPACCSSRCIETDFQLTGQFSRE